MTFVPVRRPPLRATLVAQTQDGTMDTTRSPARDGEHRSAPTYAGIADAAYRRA
ncbi:hypothetical protein GCM10022415_32560 [Knoellia locipacati]|uniref:Uncharacterized protein n=1 Tax=Knoellia locipacati TaxID=882824 RepID=A0A512T3D3_9MICO|nr:hypothetical protein KLO01_27870 [Knoellia locipacati]